jgi:capsular exopolysaccharide synthesis family protein
MLLGEAPASEAIQPISGNLPIGLVASGPLAPNPAELLASKRAVAVIEELDSQCDLLLIDSPPVLPVTDAQVISGLVDGVLLVASSGTSNKRDVRRAVELLHQVDAPLIGAILNNMHSKHESVYNYGDNRYYLDTSAPDAPEERRNGRRSKSEKRESSRSTR